MKICMYRFAVLIVLVLAFISCHPEKKNPVPASGQLKTEKKWTGKTNKQVQTNLKKKSSQKDLPRNELAKVQYQRFAKRLWLLIQMATSHDDSIWANFYIGLIKWLLKQQMSTSHNDRHRIESVNILLEFVVEKAIPVLNAVALNTNNPFHEKAADVLKAYLDKIFEQIHGYQIRGEKAKKLLEKMMRVKSPTIWEYADRILEDPESYIEKKMDVAYLLQNVHDSRLDEFFLKKLSSTQGYENKYLITYILQNSSSPASEETFLSLLRDRAPWIRELAVRGLGRLRSRKAVKQLCERLLDVEFWVRMAASAALGSIGDRDAAASLISALHDANCLVRERAAEALGKIGQGSSAHALMDALGDTDEDVRCAVAKALRNNGWIPGNGGDEVRFLIAEQNWIALEKMGAAAAPQLAASLYLDDSAFRLQIVSLLSRLQGPMTEEAIEKSLWDKNSRVRSLAREIAQKHGFPVKQEILKKVDHPDDIVPGLTKKFLKLHEEHACCKNNLPFTDFRGFNFVNITSFVFPPNKDSGRTIHFSEESPDLFEKYIFKYSPDARYAFYYEDASYSIWFGSVQTSFDDVDKGLGLMDCKNKIGDELLFCGPGGGWSEEWIDNNVFAILNFFDNNQIENRKVEYSLDVYLLEENQVYHFKGPDVDFSK